MLCLKQGDQLGKKSQFGLLLKVQANFWWKKVPQMVGLFLSKECFLYFHLKKQFQSGVRSNYFKSSKVVCCICFGLLN
jgi:hypothetical protein